jgi:hypothetical protein
MDLNSASFLRLDGDPVFIEYIRTLGLVNYDGTGKQAFQTLSDNAHARGW